MTTATKPQPAPSTMTEADRALWVQAKHDYKQAVAISAAVWMEKDETTPMDVVQAGAATVLIHITKLRAEQGRGFRLTAPTPAQLASQPEVEIPEDCPQCGGEMWDNRGDKKNPRGPDFKCKDPDCGKAIWLTPPPKRKATR